MPRMTAPNPSTAPQTLTITRPDDWHLHVRDGEALLTVVPHTAAQFGRAIIMPNLRPPVTTAQQALEYRQRILAAVPEGRNFQPLMTLYLTDNLPPKEIARAKAAGVVAVKLYPAGATTNSDAGVTDPRKTYRTLEAMQRADVPLLVHGEVTSPHYYCLPVLKREEHRLALVQAATSGSDRYFLGTDSAPHPAHLKEHASGCAGCYTAHAAMELYAEAFDAAGALDKLEGFASFHGPAFYGLPRNSGTLSLVRESWTPPDSFAFGEADICPPCRWPAERGLQRFPMWIGKPPGSRPGASSACRWRVPSPVEHRCTRR